ncbi:FAD-dependent oxidoreductase [Arthrobacter sp. S2(2024)]|uniref:FAD-dependent oxidoreductase n=1 Tax=Arthrobacter sp. S2(2024) TaxID=3111911 RepID=UPI002FC61E08
MLIDHSTPGLESWRLDAIYAGKEELPVLADVDVVVVGGGAAGVAAATTAAEAGKSVVLVEKYGFAGGAAVAGMSGTICGLYAASDKSGSPEQVVFGFTERFRRALHDKGGLTAPQKYGKTWTVAHDPFVWRDVADDFLAAAGVRTIFHAAVVGVTMDGASHTGVVVESNAGRALIKARRTIDASGDAAVIARAGHRYRFGQDGRIQNPTTFFRIAGVDVDAFVAGYGPDSISPVWVSELITQQREAGADLPRQKIFVFTTPNEGELLVNATRLTGSDGRALNVIDPEDFTLAEINGRRQVRSYAKFIRENLPGCGDAYVMDTGVEAGIRQTRSIEGLATLENEAVVEGRKTADSICRSPWPIELHDGDKPRLQWLLDDYYDVPYLSLVPVTGSNIIVAGRCLSARHEALASARVTAQCFEYGHAAGAATIISLEQDKQFANLDVQQVRAAMRTQGSNI